jgi:archaellum component FlaC
MCVIHTNISSALQMTAKKARLIRIKDEIKFLYKKKEKLNQELYKLHLQTAQEWETTWRIIQNSIQEALMICSVCHINTRVSQSNTSFYYC